MLLYRYVEIHVLYHQVSQVAPAVLDYQPLISPGKYRTVKMKGILFVNARLLNVSMQFYLT